MNKSNTQSNTFVLEECLVKLLSMIEIWPNESKIVLHLTNTNGNYIKNLTIYLVIHLFHTFTTNKLLFCELMFPYILSFDMWILMLFSYTLSLSLSSFGSLYFFSPHLLQKHFGLTNKCAYCFHTCLDSSRSSQ